MDEVAKLLTGLSASPNAVVGKAVARRRALVWIEGDGLATPISFHRGGAPSKAEKPSRLGLTGPHPLRCDAHPLASFIASSFRVVEIADASSGRPVEAARAAGIDL